MTAAASARWCSFRAGPLRCRWCSNPETQPLANPRLYWRNKCIGCGRCVEVCPRHIGCRDLHSPDCRTCLACVENCCTGALTLAAQEMTVKELVQKLLRDEVYYHNSGGGVTLSGGEVLLQWQFAAAVLAALREQCIHTAIETAGFAPYEHLKAVADQCDRVLYDVNPWTTRCTVVHWRVQPADPGQPVPSGRQRRGGDRPRAPDPQRQ